MLNVLIAGVGGQGVALTARLIGMAALRKGYSVRGAETIGMAQRGGTIVSHVRIGEEVASPLVPEKSADVLIAFEAGEAVRAAPFLKQDARIVVVNSVVTPITSALRGEPYDAGAMIDFLTSKFRRVVVIDTDALIAACGNVKSLNVALLGAATEAGMFPFSADDVEAAMRERLAEKYHATNSAALRAGRAFIQGGSNANG